MGGSELEIRLLGPLELWRAGVQLAAGGPTQRAVLAILALHAGESVPVDTLATGIWGESDEPAGGTKPLQVHVSRLRAQLKAGRRQPLVTVPGGYRLEAEQLTIDATAFESALADGRAARAGGDAVSAARTLAAALALWRGPALMDLRDFPFAGHLAARYDELRADAAEESIAARLALGEDQSLVPELQELIAEHPYRERLHAQLMVAHYRAGQQAAALEAYTAARSRLTLDLGVEPGPELQTLQQQILAQDPALAGPRPPPVEIGAPAVSRPPAPSPARRLPPVPELFGRDALLDELAGLATRERLITLTGAGGSGKTVLALALAHRLRDAFPEGVAFADLAAVRRPEQVLPAIASALGVSPQGGRLADQLAAILAERRTLLVLDNCEHLLAAVDELAPLVGASAGLMLATSRAPLGLHAEHLVPVQPLPLPDPDEPDLASEPAVALFAHAAAAAGAQLETDPASLAAIGAICRALDGLPLAIEIAAAQTRLETVAALAGSLAERLPALPARGRDLPDRQRTMEAAIGWSLERLSPKQAAAFRRLAVFAGGFDARGAVAVLDVGRPAAIELIASLLDASLLVRAGSAAGQARFRMLEPLRAVATASADPAQRELAAQRHADFVAAEIERLCPAETGIQTPEDLAQLRLEHPNLLAALAHLVERDPDRCVEMVNLLGDYWRWTSAELLATRLVDAVLPDQRLSDRAACEALAISSQGALLRGDAFEAQALLDRALALMRRVDDDATRARVSMYESSYPWTTGGWGRAIRASRAAIRFARRSRNLKLLAWALINTPVLGNAASTVSRHQREGLRIAREHSMPFVEHNALIMRGGLFTVVEKLTEAIAAYRAAIAIAGRFDARGDTAWASNNLGTCLMRLGQTEEAQTLLLSALRIDDRIGFRSSAMYPLSGLAEIEILAGRWQNGLTLFSAWASLTREMGAEGAFLPSDLESNADLVRQAEAHIGPEAAADIRSAAERMTYREAVDFAYAINGIARG